MIALLDQHCELAMLDQPIDYRRNNTDKSPFYLQTEAPGSKLVREQFEQLTGTPIAKNGALSILGRDIEFVWRTEKSIVFTFAQICEGPRSQRDYIELAKRYSTIAIIAVPCFDFIPAKEIVHGVEETYQREHVIQQQSTLDDAARRFMALVDECYEQQCLVLVSSQLPIDELYQGRQLATPFARCASRLHEMQTWAPPAPDCN